MQIPFYATEYPFDIYPDNPLLRENGPMIKDDMQRGSILGDVSSEVASRVLDGVDTSAATSFLDA